MRRNGACAILSVVCFTRIFAMTAQTLGRLEKISLRTVWKSESGNFTPWLAQPENLRLLGETLDLDLEYEAQEKDVGPFRADILCRDTATDHWVLIENQLERTDHSHLGQLLTYAAGLDAVTIIWIAECFTEEHRAALDWLNEHTDKSINLFGLEIELFRIGNSPAAPKFNVVCKPNDWQRYVKEATSGNITPMNSVRLNFWTAFADYLRSHSKIIRPQAPSTTQWMNHPIGRSGFHLTSIASTGSQDSNADLPELRVELYLKREALSKQDFAALEAQKHDIERQIGQPLVWHNPAEKRSCRIYVRTAGDFRDEAQWPEQHAWLCKNLELFYNVFAPLVKKL
jgi:hypothetical protein